MKNTVVTFINSKKKGQKLSMLTAYDYTMAKIIDGTEINGILVGDSLGMVTLGYDSTLAVTVEDMIHHGRAVVRGVKNTLVVVDMPFMSYHNTLAEAVDNAGRIIKQTQAHAVKVEGGREILDKVKGLIKAQIPVMGHLGLTPQSLNIMGGFKVQGKSEEAAKKIIEDAKLLEEAGVFAIVLECIPEKLADLVSKSISIPTIGIGSGGGCDGQILVYQDMLNMDEDFKPKFVKTFADAGLVIKEGIKKYTDQVRDGEFPAAEHTFTMKDEVLEKLY
ncbi:MULTISPECIES: 3-methyl-2-oxobutanoate hydroxymethyltransferase [Psychrilyobacter]|uniref:3-methyl-2-oxobutanoate hydroxymethyltransferase n=1 Tax=Psychrilyobacter piezotolerans TaxID=2293438 RepID=A0ABX9KFE3_9FUSO|nr:MULTISPECIES: 3-methyl-2-oxobutanoate hydroxymethyltransferase [Psychrilyobacter]MCS5423069.1 3-methyl-2-oxobutanoate hydroxymethyltransferase [Psychrilyobacter sp. S5]NDI78499.1 3-methyl-2-oxobutanoate hydroxymethyltransferase [Psychrilyobacter piezotolerans]RDE60490.1 3-methyl-2-oxobutanoate hydroxymethyltransferase [Psychrilyobacter sp. S5]REI40520.1 3-methyl-2-oxobutanoate hydroxymethyltransferase [Psychrilyobacter piezotolerans]